MNKKALAIPMGTVFVVTIIAVILIAVISVVLMSGLSFLKQPVKISEPDLVILESQNLLFQPIEIEENDQKINVLVVDAINHFDDLSVLYEKYFPQLLTEEKNCIVLYRSDSSPMSISTIQNGGKLVFRNPPGVEDKIKETILYTQVYEITIETKLKQYYGPCLN